MIRYIIGIIVTFILYDDKKSIYDSPISNIPWELMVLFVSFPLKNSITTKYVVLKFIIDIILTVAFVIHFIRIYYRYDEIYIYTINNKQKTLISILLILLNYYIGNNIPLFIINGFVQYYLFKNVLLVYKITIPILLSLITSLILDYYKIIKINNLLKIFIQSDTFFHLLKFG